MGKAERKGGDGAGKGPEFTAAASGPGGTQVDSAGFDKMAREAQYELMEAAGLRPGPNVSLAYAIDKFRREMTYEIFLYMFFLFIFTISSLIPRDVGPAFSFRNSVRETILAREFPNTTFYQSFDMIETEKDFWDYMITVIPTYLYSDPRELNYVMQVNALAQAPRLRQVRVNAGVGSDCRTYPRVSDVISRCYPYFSTQNVNKTAIPGYPPGRMIQYRSGEDLNTEWYGTGILAYEGGGFALDIPLNYTRQDTIDMFTWLKNQKWTDEQTRAIFFDISLYNPAASFYLSCRLLFEFLPYGRINPVQSFRVYRMGLDTTRELAGLGLDGIVYILILYYMYQDVMRIRFLGIKYWQKKWNWLSWLTYAIFMVILGFKIRFWMGSVTYLNGDGSMDDREASFDFEALGWIYTQIWNWTAFCNIFVWLKSFMYLKFLGEKISRLTSTVILSSNQIFTFLLYFALVIFAYALAMYTAFGTDTAHHRSINTSYFQFWFILLRSFNLQFDPVRNVNVFLGPALLISFEILCVFGLSRITIAILCNVYADLHEHGIDDPMTLEYRNAIHKKITRWTHGIVDFIYMRSRDDVVRFQRERQVEIEAAEEAENRSKKKKKGEMSYDPAVLASLGKHVKRLSDGVVPLRDNVHKLYKKYAMLGLVPEDANEDKAEAPKPVVETKGLKMQKRAELLREALIGNKVVLPPRWQMMQTDTGRTYYVNISTRQSQWDPPVVSHAVAPQALREGGGDDEDEDEDLW